MKLMHFLLLAFFLISLNTIQAAEAETKDERQYTFTWQYTEGDDMAPRGGTTKGPAVTLDTTSDAWQSLQESGLSKKEKDRRAILAMAGPYRASFDFVETTGFTSPYSPARPYQSWGTEYIYVIEDSPDFISLQHILVMFTEDDDGIRQGPFVVKHWRQDWRFEDRDLHEYQGDNQWQHRQLSRKAAKGTWSQAVYQVDDSPRYESTGKWIHSANHSSWLSGTTWRPLPRREFSVRDDYDVLIGTNRHTITPSGWIHEEANKKVTLTSGEVSTVIAQELGFNRYERIKDHDFSAGDEYWARTTGFWSDVRSAWTDLFEQHDHIKIVKPEENSSLIGVMFENAEREFASDDDRANTIDGILQDFVAAN